MALRILIADDEPLARSRLRRLVGACRDPEATVAAEAGNAAQAMALMQRQRFDAILLDIRMPGSDGVQLAGALAALDDAPLVVFVTAHAEHAVDAFDCGALDYLTKPVRPERLQMALAKVARARPAGGPAPQALLISAPGRVVRVALPDVIYLKAELKYVTVGTAEASYLLDGSLSQIEEKYPGYFLRIHRNTLVAHSAIEALERKRDADGAENWLVRLRGADEPLAVSRRQVALVRAALGE